MVETVILAAGLAGALAGLLALARHADKLGTPASHLRGLWRGSQPPEARLLATLQSASGGHSARAEPYSARGAESGMRLVVEGLCPTVTLRRFVQELPANPEAETGFTLDLRPLPLRPLDLAEIDTGDPEFEQTFRVYGPPGQARALLDAPTRRAMRQLLVGGVRVGGVCLEGGDLSVDVPTTGFAGEHPGLDQAARAVGALSRRLAAPDQPQQRLAANVREDPEPGVRLQNLVTLLREHPDHPLTIGALRTAARDRDGEVRLRAGIELGEEGRDLLLALAADETVEDQLSARTIDALGASFPLQQARTMLGAACRGPLRGSRRPESTRACIAALGRKRGVEGVEAALIEALALRHDEGGVEAARALGAQGSAASVLPLKEAADRHGGALGSAARQAIAEIQSRLTGSPGELSLAEGEGGRLSLTEGASGRISLADSGPGDPDAPDRP